jgi:murein DD-endopeptidase MepM/ murein hydrolase activator NlpD
VRIALHVSAILVLACATPRATKVPLELNAHQEPELVLSKEDGVGSISQSNERHPKSTVSTATIHGSLHWPVRGLIYARFGMKGSEPHDGIDLAVPLGTPVHASDSGIVLFAGEQKGYGLLVVIEHEEGLLTLYAHNQSLNVKVGQTIRADEVVSTVGSSGQTSGPHLHFEVRKNGKPVDPLLHLAAVPEP